MSQNLPPNPEPKKERLSEVHIVYLKKAQDCIAKANERLRMVSEVIQEEYKLTPLDRVDENYFIIRGKIEEPKADT